MLLCNYHTALVVLKEESGLVSVLHSQTRPLFACSLFTQSFSFSTSLSRASSLLLSPSLSLYMKICFSFSLEAFFFLLEVSASQTQTAMYTNENQRLLVSIPDFTPFLLRYGFHVKMKNIPNNDRGDGQRCGYCVPVMKVFRDRENTDLWFLSAVSLQHK